MCCVLFSHLGSPGSLLWRKALLPAFLSSFALPFLSPISDCSLTHFFFFSEVLNLHVSSAHISVKEVSFGSLQKRKWKVEHYLVWNVLESLCWASLRVLRPELPEKADKSSRHPVIQLLWLSWLRLCSAWVTHKVWFWWFLGFFFCLSLHWQSLFSPL